MYTNTGMMRPQLQMQNSVAPGRNNSNYTGNPMGVYNSRPNFQSSGQQQQNLGRYTPPTYNLGNNNQPQWQNQGGYEYNVPNSYGGPGNYYGQTGQGYGRQGMQQGYGGDGGGYYNQGRMRPQFEQQYNQQQYMGRPDQYQSFGQQQPQFSDNPYASGQLPSIMATYGTGDEPQSQMRNNKGPAPDMGEPVLGNYDTPFQENPSRGMEYARSARPMFDGGGGGSGGGWMGPQRWGGRMQRY